MIQNSENPSANKAKDSGIRIRRFLGKKKWKDLRKIAKNENTEADKVREGIKIGKWQPHEHQKFLQACSEHGSNWSKIQEILKNRSAAQIRSHAQKYIMKLCKKYQIKIKSKKFKKKSPKHLDYINKSKSLSMTSTVKEYDPLEKKLLETFNYYIREYKPFSIEKIHELHDDKECKRVKDNERTQLRLKNQIFLVKKNKNKNHTNEKSLLNINYRSDKFTEKLLIFHNTNETFYKNLISNHFSVDFNTNMLNSHVDAFFRENFENNPENSKIYENSFLEIKNITNIFLENMNNYLELFQFLISCCTLPTSFPSYLEEQKEKNQKFSVSI